MNKYWESFIQDVSSKAEQFAELLIYELIQSLKSETFSLLVTEFDNFL